MKHFLTLLLLLGVTKSPLSQNECGFTLPEGEEFERTLAYIDMQLACVGLTARCEGIRRIQTVIHIIHHDAYEIGEQSNISDDQAISIVEELSHSFRGMSMPGDLDFGLEFILACVDPFGNLTNGIVRYPMVGPELGLDENGVELPFTSQVKQETVWDQTRYLNIWVSEMTNLSLNGWSQYPTSDGIHGVVLNWRKAGMRGTDDQFDGTRTGPHEVGHYLFLFHTFQGGEGEDCPPDSNPYAQGDRCADTPAHRQSEIGCGVDNTIESCYGATYGEYVHNLMCYGTCRNEWTNDQKNRALAAIDQYRPEVFDCTESACIASFIGIDNPSSNEFLEMSVESTIRIHVRIVNGLGQIVSDFDHRYCEPVTGVTQVPIPNLASGIYTVQINVLGLCGGDDQLEFNDQVVIVEVSGMVLLNYAEEIEAVDIKKTESNQQPAISFRRIWLTVAPHCLLLI